MPQLQVTAINEQTWEGTYTPQSNHLNPDASWNGWGQGDRGVLFETYGLEEDFIYNVDPHYVWTLVDDDDDDEGHEHIENGRHFVNRVGYFVCKTPWTDETAPIIVVLDSGAP